MLKTFQSFCQLRGCLFSTNAALYPSNTLKRDYQNYDHRIQTIMLSMLVQDLLQYFPL